MFKLIHSGISYLVVLLVLFTFVNAIVKLRSKESFKKNDFIIALAAAMLLKLQLVLGIVTYYFSVYYQTLREVGFKTVMKDSSLRLFILEHPLMMLIGASLIIVGFYKHKKATTDISKFKTLAWFYGLGLLLILSRIPWTQWFNS
jgi:heme A synthase